MNLTLAEAAQLVKAVADGIKGLAGVEVLVGPPFTTLLRVKEAIGKTPILLAGRTCTGKRRAHSPEKFPLRCSRMPDAPT